MYSLTPTDSAPQGYRRIGETLLPLRQYSRALGSAESVIDRIFELDKKAHRTGSGDDKIELTNAVTSMLLSVNNQVKNGLPAESDAVEAALAYVVTLDNAADIFNAAQRRAAEDWRLDEAIANYKKTSQEAAR